MLTKVPTLDTKSDPYKWRDDQGFWARAARPGRGMWYDVKRRLPYYWSDIVDGWAYRVFAGTIRIFFVNLLPALAFQLDMYHNTDGFFGINEALLSSALAAIVFSTLSAQPLTVVGITGLISLFNYTIYDIIILHDVTLYPRFMVWVGIWAAVWHWAVALTNLCDYMRTITDFSSQTFGLYVGTIYVIKGCEELAINFEDGQISNGFASAMVAILYFLTVFFLDRIGQTAFATSPVRKFLSEYAYPLATIWWTGFTHIPGNLAYANFTRLPVTRAFYPTVDRSWVVPFWTLPVKWIFVALPIGGLMMLLFYYDHNVSSLTAQARNFPLKKPAGFHWDFFLLGWTCFIAGILNIPLPNGLVPQAPVHTDALTYYKDEPEHVSTKDYEAEPVMVRHNTTAIRVAEQRVSHFVMGLLFVGMMTGPLLTVLHTMPRAILSGVFFTVGLGGILSNPILVHKLKFLFTQRNFIPPHEPLLKVKRSQIWHYLGWQLLGWATTVAISQTIAAIGFPVLIMALIPLRWKFLPRLFTREELDIMDDLTADREVVLVSLGGKPELPEDRLMRGKESRGDRLDPERGAAGLEGGRGGIKERQAELNQEEDADFQEKNRQMHAGSEGHALKRKRQAMRDDEYADDSEGTRVNSGSNTSSPRDDTR
ncbi:hypothetical protein LTR70_004772 [Exophiala xenobiotica]|uniref:Bicarbonate transporter-like transmembrane domain-containing protein n=1 Tax=Lithohypha guttulata TaxID=1690604 RepID=A0ABR0KE90_9EURO|nr:hypothetical protein LTR24_004264 [Lithohypha guttulata]KAK5319862.1 hypothetical protein LTR70_004772 [Exophiala xenobiotica]